MSKESTTLPILWTCLSITKMLHMEMLAEAIQLLGDKPVIRGTAGTCSNYWDRSYIRDYLM